ncbi:hypothetical protein NA57DRAFT_74876 [Rhizodiscina lignyota]|uniref:CFEM domain-containing protein n=1 Tax=Rhizodiscina lignyota TaxID=1504668 RepID=A0A9P4IHH2_9PEZI|nr:hypothetical protein NA57DRAFT_74876 [Rhizodiscina lignyota]
MRTSTTALTVLSLSLAAYAQSDAELESSLPLCAATCAGTAATMNGCGIQDFACTCAAYGPMKMYVAPCLASTSTCTGEQINNMFATIDQICSNYFPLSWNNAPPTDPAQPVAPIEPSAPAVPSDPAVPSVPTDPAVPLTPTVPSDPAAPSVASDLAVPSDPAATPDPAIPSAPAVPSSPAVPSAPVVARGMKARGYANPSTLASSYPTGVLPTGSGGVPIPTSTSVAPMFEGAAGRTTFGMGAAASAALLALFWGFA